MGLAEKECLWSETAQGGLIPAEPMNKQ
jgi:hypothetical protein